MSARSRASADTLKQTGRTLIALECRSAMQQLVQLRNNGTSTSRSLSLHWLPWSNGNQVIGDRRQNHSERCVTYEDLGEKNSPSSEFSKGMKETAIQKLTAWKS